LFTRLAAAISQAVSYPVVRHIANSAGVERFPEAAMEMVRLGIGLYGISAAADGNLRAVSTLCSRIVQIKELAPGETVGYGRAGLVTRPSRIATVPVGYADGLDRGLGLGRWSVLAGGASAPTIGRICMDTCMVDVTGLDVAEGDTVTVFGPTPGNRVEDMARVLGTIPYEVMTGISTRVKRIFIKE
jgi:alanine racemase